MSPCRVHPVATLVTALAPLLTACSSDVESAPGDGGGGGTTSIAATSTAETTTSISSGPNPSSSSAGGGDGGSGQGTGGSGAGGDSGTGGFGTGGDPGTGGFGTGGDSGTGGFGTGGFGTGGFGTGGDSGAGGFGTGGDSGSGGFGTGGDSGTGGFGTGGFGTGGFGTGGSGTGGGPPEEPCGAQLDELVAAFRADALIESGLGDGDAIALWEDEGAFGLDVGQVSAGSRPTLQLDELGGHAVVRFDGDDDHLLGSLPISSFGADPSITLIVVAQASPLSFTEQRPLLRFGEASANFGGLRLVQGDPGLGYGMFFQVYPGASVNQDPPGIAHDAAAETSVSTVWSASRTGADVTLRKRGVEFATDVPAPTLDVTSESFAIGTANPGFDVWMGDVAEVLVFGPQLEDADVEDVEACLIARYGLP